MSRNENEDLVGLELPDPKTTESTYCVENGEILTEKEFDHLIKCYSKQKLRPPIACAKSIFHKLSNTNSYMILSYGSMAFDPNNNDSRYRSRNRWKMTRVKKTTYDLYTRFLRTKHKTFLHQAEREL